MNSKALIGVVAVIIIVAVAAVAIGMGGGDDENKGFTGVVYDGNGGKTSNGDTTFRLTSEEVQSSLFTNGDMVFDGWNTKADGTGTAYKPGDSISYPEHGYVTLYAQWTANTSYHLVGYSPGFIVLHNPDGSVDDSGLETSLKLDLNGHVVNLITMATLTVNSGTNIIQLKGAGDDWEWDNDRQLFTFTYNGHPYTAKITVTNGQDGIGFMSNNIPSYGFTANSDISIKLEVVYVK